MNVTTEPLCQEYGNSDDFDQVDQYFDLDHYLNQVDPEQCFDLASALEESGTSFSDLLNSLQPDEDEPSSKKRKRTYDTFHYFNCNTKKNIFLYCIIP